MTAQPENEQFMSGPVLSCGRDYQDRIVQETERLWSAGHRGVLTVMPTGTGKTRVASTGIARFIDSGGGHVLWLAHRIELVRQAAETLQSITGQSVALEVPGLCSNGDRIVVASKDTIRTDGRLSRLSSEAFDLIVIDEAHHSVASTYSKLIDTWSSARLWGLTATPDRLDKRNLHHFTAMTTQFTVPDAIEQGWLVPVLAKRVKVKSVDLSGVKTQAGDFVPGELNAIMSSEETLHGICQNLLDASGDRPTIVYCTSIGQSERISEILGRHRSGCARHVDGHTPPEVRSALFADYLAGRFQYLCNVEIATEGIDLPPAACVAMARPTKSRSLFSQMLGRVLRPHGVNLNVPGEAESRRHWIWQSRKPNALVLDFTSNTGRHSVVTADVVLSDGRISEPVRARLQRKLDAAGDSTVDVEKAIRAAQKDEDEAEQRRAARREKEEAARRNAVAVGRIRIDTTDTKLIGLGGVYDGDLSSDGKPSPIDPGQVEALRFLNLPFVTGETRSEARKRILSEQVRLEAGRCTRKQYNTLMKFYPKLASLEMSKVEAGKKIAGLAMRGWKVR